MDRVSVIDELPAGPTDIAPDRTVADTLAERCGQKTAFDGITVRDYFAAAALTGLLASHTGEVQLPADAKAARWAFELADAMLKARSV
jgi:hypothetical protein